MSSDMQRRGQFGEGPRPGGMGYPLSDIPRAPTDWWFRWSGGPSGFAGKPGYTSERLHQIVNVAARTALGVHTKSGADRPAKGRTSAIGRFDHSHETSDAAI